MRSGDGAPHVKLGRGGEVGGGVEGAACQIQVELSQVGAITAARATEAARRVRERYLSSLAVIRR